ncbi:MAG: helix-turn-helix domain-containing protein [Planctomycetes bacterium]|nr:helix-turn-helix domain-containing protein [Planctomycetota bacterium]
MEEIKAHAVYTREEAEKLLKISRTTMKRLIKEGVIHAAKIGSQYRILGAELLRLLLPDSGYSAARDLYHKSRELVHEMEQSLEEDNN